jgi:endoglucanase
MRKFFAFSLATVFSICAFSQTNGLIYGKIPIDPVRWYQINTTTNGLGQLFDNDLTKNPETGWGKMLSNFDAWYPVLKGEKITLDEIRFYDKYGVFTTQPLTVSVITDTWQRIPVATFTGAQYDVWVGPYPGRSSVFKLDTPVTNIKYLVINSWSNYPAELELRGWYKAPDPVASNQKTPVPLKNFFGINAFEWNFLNNYNGYTIDETSMQGMKSFTGFRHYIDWEKLEQTEGSYSFNPTRSGGWNYDTIYQRCKSDGIEVLACIKQMPGWMKATYPTGEDKWDNVPVRYGKDFSDPNSYLEQAKVAFQYAARYGSNKNVNRALVSVNSTPRWTADRVNVVKIGMGLVKYIECNNEEDKWWRGRGAYQTGREYAANLSAFYDGNMNTMGPGAGVKNADSTILVVMGGTASATTDYVRGMIDWCKQYRGYKADGSVNVCWDIINYHFFSNDARSSQNGSATRGAAPEIAGTKEAAASFISMAHQYLSDMPVWMTEAGYDTKSEWSSQEAIPIGSKTVLQTQADWILRTALLYSRCGVQKVFFYKTYDDSNYGGQFGTCGLLNSDKSRRPATDFLIQTNQLFGNYAYKETLNNDPVVDRYELNGNNMFALTIPDEKGRTAEYSLNVGDADSATLYTPFAGSDHMTIQTLCCSNNSITINVTETPVFVIPHPRAAQTGSFTSTQKSNSVAAIFERKAIVYPNPFQNFFTLSGLPANKKLHLLLVSSDGKVIQKADCVSASYTWDVHSLSSGIYYVIINDGNFKQSIPILKTN